MNERLSEEKLTTAYIVSRRLPQTDMHSASDVMIDACGTQSFVEANERLPPNPLFEGNELHSLRTRWDEVQTSFVDEPHTAVEQADRLVANVVNRIAEQFAAEREQLEKQWDRGESVDTEELRQAFKRYRSFFDRLLAF